MDTRTAPDAARGVGILSANAEALDDLESYLRNVGFQKRKGRPLEECSEVTRGSPLAVVLFPDEFRREHVSAQNGWSTTAPTWSSNVVVDPRPIWGSALLESSARTPTARAEPRSYVGLRCERERMSMSTADEGQTTLPRHRGPV